jgi:hypothetical protein
VSTAEARRPGRELEGFPGTFSRAFKPRPIIERPFNPREQAARRQLGLGDDAKRYSMGQATIFVAREPAGVNGEMLWHLSMSLRHRHPDWDELKFARYVLLPHELCFGILLPPPDLYVNVPAQDHVFHLWEVRDVREPWGAE